jgi:hypothetical protein
LKFISETTIHAIRRIRGMSWSFLLNPTYDSYHVHHCQKYFFSRALAFYHEARVKPAGS